MLCVLLAMALSARASNISVGTPVLSQAGEGHTHIDCQVSWDNSWRASWEETAPSVTVTNWDAAWLFVKYRAATNNAPWQHASLSTNDSDHTVPGQAVFKVAANVHADGTTAGVGGFLYRAETGSGSWTNRVSLKWNYAQDGVADMAQVVVCVYAIEMVYVPQGSFFVGDGTVVSSDIMGQFCSGTSRTLPFQITREGPITLGGCGAGSLGNNHAAGMINGSDDFNDLTIQVLPATFPKGHDAFYCMKYEISQGQYVNFLNKLTRAQQASRVATRGANKFSLTNTEAPSQRNGIRCPGVIPGAPTATTFLLDGDADGTADEPHDGFDRACNWLSWGDGAAYADWAGLRPMTELEFEKACRGPLIPVTKECAWGNTTLSPTTALVNDGTGAEAASGGNCNYGKCSPVGPYRVGIYATPASDRTASGASYWGILDLSGSVYERAISVGVAAGRLFTGVAGDGHLSDNGCADAEYWPPANTGAGVGSRGGQFLTELNRLSVSARYYASTGHPDRTQNAGFRAVRQAP